MNEKKGSPIATIKGIFGSSKILFICIVYTIAVIGNVVQKFEDRIDFEGMEFFGIKLSDVIGAELVGMLQTVSNVLFAISLISLMPMVLMAVGYWLIKKGAGEGNGNTRCALVALDFFKYNLLYQAFMKISLAFGALVLGLFGAVSLFSAGSAGIGLVVLLAVVLVDAVLLLLFRYYTNFTSMLVGVSNTLRTGVNLVTRSRMVMIFNIISAIWIILTSLGNGIIAILAAVADALCLIFINRCFSDYENECSYADKDENAEVMERIKTDPALARTASALGITQITPEQAADGVKPTLSFRGIANLLFGLSIAPIDEVDLSSPAYDDRSGENRPSGSQVGGSAYTTPAKPNGPVREAEYRVLSLFDNDVEQLDRRYSLLGSTSFGSAAACPVMLKSAAVVKDQVSEKSILRLAFNNASVCAIKKVCLDIVPKTNADAPICIYKNVALTFDTPAASGEDFGACFGVILPDDATCGSVKITYVEFDDGLYWDKQSAENDFVTDEKRDFDKRRLEEYEQRRRAEEERRNAENNNDHSDDRSDESDAASTPIKESIAPLVLAILSAVSLVLGVLVPYFIFRNFGLGFLSTANLNAVSLISLVMNLLPFALAFSSLLTRKQSAKYGKIASGISIAVIALTSFQRLMGGASNLLFTLLVVCMVFGIIALVKKDKPLYLPLLLIAALIGIFLSAMFLFDFGASNKGPESDNSGGTLAGNADGVVAFEPQYQSNGDGTCRIIGYYNEAPEQLVISEFAPNGDRVTSIGDEAFYGCNTVREVILPASVQYIGVSAFRECGQLSSVSMPGVVNIAHYAFQRCEALTQVTSTGMLESIGDSAFAECYQLYSFEYAHQLRWIGSSAFAGSSLFEFIMSDNVNSIGQNAFYDCDRLNNLRLSRSLDRIPYGAFSDCSSLETVEIPGSVTNIEGNAFSYCSSLIEVVMYPGVICIEEMAFSDCYALEYVHFPSSIELIEDGAFYCCSGISRISYGGTEDMWQRFIWEQVDENSWTGINDALQWASMEYQNGDERQDDGGPICEEAATTDIPAEYEGN